MHHLEGVQIASDSNLVDVRFSVRYVSRRHDNDYHDYRGYADQMASGVMKPGDEVILLPSGLPSTINEIYSAGKPAEAAHPPMLMTFRLNDEVDVSRGAKSVRSINQPLVAQNFEAMVCWRR